ncbi:MAG: hypothetical protein ACREQN_09490 [Candidatus Binataceae bacterium]
MPVRIANLSLAAATLILATMVVAGCGHKLVSTTGDTSVAVYPDKASYDRLQSLKTQGGALGMLGGVGSEMVSKKVDIATPVKILSSDPEGDVVEVLSGPNQGLKGYIAKSNID